VSNLGHDDGSDKGKISADNYLIVEVELISSQNVRRKLMRFQLKCAVGVLALLGISGITAPEAMAQRRSPSIPEQFERAFFRSSDNFYENRSIFDQIGFYLLPMTYPERQAARDAERVNRLYRSVMEVQNTSDPTIRTRDLTSPFSESLQTMPSYSPSGVPFNPQNQILPLY
jgi:hypothetical protein